MKLESIIAITGLIGSGKNEAADYIAKNYSYVIFDYADLIREMMRKEGIEPTRINIQNYRLKHGNNFLAEAIVEKIQNSSHERVLLTPIRRPEDYEMPKKAFGASIIMIHIDADEQIRFERLKSRRSARDPKTPKEFKEQEKRELEIFNFKKTFKYANYTIENNGTLEELHKKLNSLMKKVST
ncbi:MAG: AAA family ATPase [Candidatus Aenigmarchaeota archaeon]|nr:AAA family ATPase [Candidatus Aenigmarchaeota archaeon]